MSQIISNLKVFGDFDPKLRQQIKCCFVSKTNAYCVLNDNKVYGLGENIHQILGYNESNKKYVLIEELCNQSIEEFYEGYRGYTMFARSKTNEIFCWGKINRSIPKPHKIEFLDDKDIINIICESTKSYALSSNGLIYECKDMGSWGSRSWNLDKEYEFIPCNIFEEIDLITNVKNISINSLDGLDSICVESLNGAIHEYIIRQGRWSERDNCNLKGVQELIKNNFDEENNEIIDFCFDRDHQVICQTKSRVYVYSREHKDSKVAKTDFKTIFKYFLHSIKGTYKTVHFEGSKYYVYNIEITTKDNSKQLVNIRKEYDLTEYCPGQNETKSFLRKFFYSKDLPQISGSIIKYYYQLKNDGFYVVNDKNGNKVYCHGRNHNGVLGLGHKSSISEHTEIIELGNKNIEDFYTSKNFTFGRNDKNEIFSWGYNKYGQLARGTESESTLDCLKPDKINFKGKQIIDISIGWYHCLALSSEGCVYGWGKNYWRQNLGIKNDYILSPEEIVLEKLNLKIKIKFIHCSKKLSFVVTAEGEGYYWGELDDGLIFNQKIVPVTNVNKLSCFTYSRVIILDNYGNLSLFDLKNEVNNKIDIKWEEKIIDLYKKCLQSEEWVYQLTNSSEIIGFELIKTNYKSIGDFLLNEKGYYKKTIEITEKGRLRTKAIHFELNSLRFKKLFIFDSKYETEFEQIGKDRLGKGNYGEVFKVMKKSNKVHYAIKIMEIKETKVMEKGLEELGLKDLSEIKLIGIKDTDVMKKGFNELVLKEIKTMKELSTDFVVEYIDSWIQEFEEKTFLGTNKLLIIFIQMELCPHNLRYFIEIMHGTTEKKFQEINYFISCELLKELIECVNHLHSLPKPLGPIIHRDLKPENILISDGINGKFLKLCDFGLAKIHEESNHTTNTGTRKYWAPEVPLGKYNIKADIYSLALIATEIIQLEDAKDGFIKIRGYTHRKDFDLYLAKYSGTILENNVKILLDMISNCLTPKDYHSRPECKDLNDYEFDKNIVLNDENISDFKLFLKNQNIILFKKFFETKIEAKQKGTREQLQQRNKKMNWCSIY